MPRKVQEWVGKTDDSRPPTSVFLRCFDRAGGRCEVCLIKIGPKKWELDHRKRLRDGGENRESNLQVLCLACHAEKTGQENKGQAKANRIRAKHLGIKRKRGGFKGWRRFDGTIVWADKKRD